MKKKSCLKKWTLCLAVLLLQTASFFATAQCKSTTDIDTRLRSIENDTIMTTSRKMEKVSELKKEFENCRFPKDSVYARLLHRLGFLEYSLDAVISVSVIENTLTAIRINTSGSRNVSAKFAVNSYNNLAYVYENAFRFSKSLAYFDTVLLLNKNYPDQIRFSVDALSAEAYIYIQQGDYEKCREVCTKGVNLCKQIDDTSHLAEFYNYRAFGYTFQGLWQFALNDADTEYIYASRIGYEDRIIDAIKLKAIAYAGLRDFKKADLYFSEALRRRMKQGQDGKKSLDEDYVDYGNYFLNKRKDYNKAIACYSKVISQPGLSQNNLSICKAYTNIAQADFRSNQLDKARENYDKAFLLFNIPSPNDFLKNAKANNLSLVWNKELLFVFLNNKTEILLALYKATKDEKLIRACLQTAMVTDSVIVQTRHQQLGEQSKLYWRNTTRDFYNNAIEACYLANDTDKAFYFMEKSRAVLLYDKLNELGASAHLSAEQSNKEENYQIRLIELQQKLSAATSNSEKYYNVQTLYLQTKEDFEHYSRSLEKTSPLYYQYKYADNTLLLSDLQRFLSRNNQSFVYYFNGDTATYMLGISKNKTSFIKISANDFDTHQLSEFINLCSNKQATNNNYETFASLSQSIYNCLFKPLQLPKGNVAICTDNFFIPFEALCTDDNGKNFLIYDYNFSYVYSARSLVKPFTGNKATDNFAGFAPVNFSSRLGVLPLLNSATALTDVAGYYSNSTLFTKQEATRNNFFNQASKYAVVTIFSHAQADTTDKEPVLYMQDSLIHLSELGLLRNPAIQFVLLSACQTNIGRNATGEGIYSLARGFAAAGVPSVSATLWKADEEAVYQISAKFNEYLSHGMNKSEALQKAKIWYLQNSNREHTMPYYWANMVLIGTSQPITLTTSNHWWYWVAGVTGFALIISVASYFIYTKLVQAKK